MPRREELQDVQWSLISPLLPKVNARAGGRGRPRSNARTVLSGILWALRSGARVKIGLNVPPHIKPAIVVFENQIIFDAEWQCPTYVVV